VAFVALAAGFEVYIPSLSEFVPVQGAPWH
jgi:hypothetical protein